MSVQDWNGDQWEAFHAGMQDDEIAMDPWVQALFDIAVYNTENMLPGTYDREDIIDAIDRYLYDEYGVIFDEIFDWDEFRETYGQLRW